MGYVLSDQELAECGGYLAEVRAESFVMSGPCHTPIREPISGDVIDEVIIKGMPLEAMWVYKCIHVGHGNAGAVEIRLADIPKIRAILDAVEKHTCKIRSSAP